jgi:tellurite resistance protein TehA-like permease
MVEDLVVIVLHNLSGACCVNFYVIFILLEVVHNSFIGKLFKYREDTRKTVLHVSWCLFHGCMFEAV